MIGTLLLGPALLAFEPASFTTARLPAFRAAEASFPTPIRHVIVLFMEDQGISNVLANGSFERYLAAKYAFASQYYGLTSDSLANYRIAASGLDSNGTATTLNVPALVDRVGETWAAYEESMPIPCDRNSTYFNTSLNASTVGNQTNHLVYDINHDPFALFKNISSNPAFCRAHVVNLDAWTAALQNDDLPNYVWVTPNDTDNDHHCPPVECPYAIPHGDAWLRAFLTPFLNSSAFSDSVLFLTYDYNSTEHSRPNHTANVYFVALSPYAKPGYNSMNRYTPYNLLTTTEWLLDLGLTGNKDNWSENPPMKDLFYLPTSYNVTFTESGLPQNTIWSVTLGGGLIRSSTSTIAFSERNGSYAYTIGFIPGWRQTTLPCNGTVTVRGAPLNEPTLVFARVTYPVVFSERGLPSGVTWYVNFTSGPAGFVLPSGMALADSPISVSLANGSYRYSVETSDPSSRAIGPNNLTESAGTPRSERVTFAQAYLVTFMEAGLPSGMSWSVTLNGTRVGSNTSTLSFSEPNGTDPYTIEDLSGWHQSTIPYAGTVTVFGAAVAEPTLQFLRVTYDISFTEFGLPSAIDWWVNLTNGQTFGTANDSFSLSEPNGTYDYRVASANPEYASEGGAFTVAGATRSETVTFRLVTYVVTFAATGLPNGTTWSVLLGGVLHTSALNAITFAEPNGSYDFSVTNVSGFSVSPDNGTASVRGSAVNESVVYAAACSGCGLLHPASSGLTPAEWAISLVIPIVAAGSWVGLRYRRRGKHAGPAGPKKPR